MQYKVTINNYQKGAKLKTTPTHKIISQKTLANNKHEIIYDLDTDREKEFIQKVLGKKLIPIEEKLEINENESSMKYKTYGSIEKCFNILVNEKGYSKEEAQDIIDHILADYKYNPNSNNSLLRQINLVLSKDEYEKEYGITERYTRLREKETPNIEVKHEGILEVPEGKKVDELPYSHFEKLAKKKGLSKITRALNNLQVWNKNDDKELSKWAGNMIDKLNKKLKKDESLKESIYTDMGFSDRKEYLNSLADDYEVDIQTVYDLASVLGPDEDFDALVTELEDLMYNGEDTFKSFDQELHYDLLHYNYVVCDKDVDIFDFIIVHFDTYEDAIRCVFNNLGWFVSDCVLYDTRKHLKITYVADKLDISKLDTGKNTVYDLDDFKSNPLRFIDKYTVGEDAAIENVRDILDMCEVSTEKY